MKPVMITEYFSDVELSCRGTGRFVFPRSGPERECVMRTLELADQLRREYGSPLLCLSGYRSPMHNLRIGGALRSMHKILALDLRPADGDVSRLYSMCIGRVDGLGLYPTFVHVDLRKYVHRPTAQWTHNTDWSP